MLCFVLGLLNRVTDSTAMMAFLGFFDAVLYLLFAGLPCNRSKKRRICLLLLYAVISLVFDAWGYCSYFPKGAYLNPGMSVIWRLLIYLGSIVAGASLFSLFHHFKDACAGNRHA